jgi:hypothetical protein
MKKVFISLLLCTASLSTPTTKPTLITLKWESSEILSDSEGKNPTNINPFNNNSIWKYKLQHHYIEESNFEIRQVDDNSFEVLGSPLEWEGRNVK